MAHPIPQNPWQATHQPQTPFAPYPAYAHGAAFGSGGPHATSPVAAYLTSAFRNAPIGTIRSLLTQDEAQQVALSGMDPVAAAGLAALGLGAVALVAMFAAQVAAGYYVGKTVAPTRDDERAYGIGGAIATGLGGPFGAAAISVLGIVKGSKLAMSYELRGVGGLGAVQTVSPAPSIVSSAPSPVVSTLSAVIGLVAFAGGAYYGWKYGDEYDHPIRWAIAGSFAGSILGGMASNVVVAAAG